ncbi:MAG TPA: LamG domain-containing protein [Kofleriaceae bacterium]|nr:LamG domain-containing protein [Kofleriaceae bacterium]
MLFGQVALIGVGGCASDETDPQDLQALLHDEPLKQVFPGASSSASSGTTDPGAVDSGKHSDIVLPSANPAGVWNFDDCNTSRTNLSDSSFNGNTAFRSVGVTCTDGIRSSQAVSISIPEDIVYVPDQPNFTFSSGVTVAGWFRPAALGGTKTLFRKRDKDTSSFALLLDAGKFTFVVNLGDGHAVSVIAPMKAKAGVYQHVAATYDGMVARLYVDGTEVNTFPIAGAIPPGPGPLLMGNDGSERRYSGSFDSTLFATHALTATEVAALTCFPVPATVSLSPSNQSVPAGGTATIDIALTNNNSAACAPLTFSIEPESFDSRVVTNPPSFTLTPSAPVPSGTTGHFTVTASPSVDMDPTNVFIDFFVSEPVTNTFAFLFAGLTVTEAVGCHVSTSRELMIKSTTVVDDPIRTVFNPSSTDSRNGVWTFKHLVENMAPTPDQAPAMVEAMLNTFGSPQTINGFTVDARSGMQSLILAFWPRTADGALDLAQAPLRLQAIVNRFDLRDLGNGDAGEGRFVFAFNRPFSGFPLQATLIFEYKLPATTDQDVLDWAQSFHSLGGMQLGESYNAALQQITERFVGRNARPDHPNGNAINAVRTNEIAFSDNGLWELREFHLSASSGLLEPSPVALTPDRSFNFSSTLASFINANQDAIIAEKHVVPELFNGQPFQAGAIFNNGTWFAPGTDGEARHHFALNTCNGCHSSAETNVPFLQISPRFPGSEAFLSAFLTGTTKFDPETGQARTFNDLGRRNADLTAIVCTDGAAFAGANGTTLRKGISRVH